MTSLSRVAVWKILLAAVLVLQGACLPTASDDAFARTFIENLRTRNPGGEAQLQPRSEMSRAGWDAVLVSARDLSATVPDSVVLREIETLRDEHGRARKLTYGVHSGTRYVMVEIWLVSHEGQTYVNTLQITS
jgi:hypothetical protein